MQMVQVLVSYVPDIRTLGDVAAGPIEDLMEGEFIRVMQQEAENNPRFRVALGMTNDLAEQLEPFAEQKADFEELPPIQPISVTAEEIEFMVTYFHNVDTRWADSLLEELNLYNPAEALFMLQMLLDKAAKTPDLLKDVFVHAVDPFVRINLTAYRSELTALAMRNETLRQWFIRTIYPWTDDPEAWAVMIKQLNS